MTSCQAAIFVFGALSLWPCKDARYSRIINTHYFPVRSLIKAGALYLEEKKQFDFLNVCYRLARSLRELSFTISSLPVIMGLISSLSRRPRICSFSTFRKLTEVLRRSDIRSLIKWVQEISSEGSSFRPAAARNSRLKKGPPLTVFALKGK